MNARVWCQYRTPKQEAGGEAIACCAAKFDTIRTEEGARIEIAPVATPVKFFFFLASRRLTRDAEPSFGLQWTYLRHIVLL